MHVLNRTAFYIVAHADDWQLFMSPEAFEDIMDSYCKVIFIITTAGDAGMQENFWMAREDGLKSSIRLCLAATGDLKESCGCKVFKGHAINYWVINNTISYFLRLPDGNLDGSGFASGSFKSISKLESGLVHEVGTVDNSSRYQDWKDLVNTIEAIVYLETHQQNNGTLNYINPCTASNSHDHPDHIATGRAVQEMPTARTLRQRLFVGYSLANAEELLTTKDLFWKSAMMTAYEKTVFEKCGYSTLKENVDLYINWCGRSSKFMTK
jgi:hypothetical protein